MERHVGSRAIRNVHGFMWYGTVTGRGGAVRCGRGGTVSQLTRREETHGTCALESPSPLAALALLVMMLVLPLRLSLLMFMCMFMFIASRPSDMAAPTPLEAGRQARNQAHGTKSDGS